MGRGRGADGPRWFDWVRIGEFAGPHGKEEGRWSWTAGPRDRSAGRGGAEGGAGHPHRHAAALDADQAPDMVALDKEGRPRGFGSRGTIASATRAIARNRRGSCRSWPNATGATACGRLADRQRIWLPRYGAQLFLGGARCLPRLAGAEVPKPAGAEPRLGQCFWSMDIASFDEDRTAEPDGDEPNPAHVMAFRRFASDEVAATTGSRPRSSGATRIIPIAHNYMGNVTSSTISRWAPISISPAGTAIRWASCRPAGRFGEHKRAHLRQGDPDMQAFHHDLYRAVGRGRVVDHGATQAGPVELGAVETPRSVPGMARLWAWEAFAHGAEAVCYFRGRQAPFAQEQMHAGCCAPLPSRPRA